MAVIHREVDEGKEAGSIVARASALSGWLGEQAVRIEDEKRIPEDVAARLIDAGFFRMTQPRRFGGLGCTPRQAWEAVFALSQGCGSCAWLAGLNAANALMLAKFSEKLQEEVFATDRPAIIAMLTGGVGENIAVKRVEDGAVLSGRWHYASGIDIASWAGLLVPLPGIDGTAAEPYILLVPQEAFLIDHSSWNVLGMRGTGSKDIELKPTFVPEHRWFGWNELQAGKKHPTCPNPESLYSYPLNSVFAMSVAAPTIGVASAVADEFCALVKTRASGVTQRRQCEDKVAQIQVAAGEGTMSLLRKALLDDADLVLDIMNSGRQPSPAERAAIRMRLAVSSRLALATAQTMFAAMGGSLLRARTRAERLFRDLNSMSSHLLLQPETIGEAYGRLLLGLELPEGARL